jgi:hypothetical protein
MDRNSLPPAAENEIRFLLSLLHIASPGQPETPQSSELEHLVSPVAR